MNKPRLPLSILLLAVTVTGACTKNPATGKRQLSLYSEGQEIEIGRQSHPGVLGQFGSLDDSRIQDYVGGTGSELAAVSHRPDLPWTFTVVDSEVINAFALPGGYIYVTREILAHMNNEAELAGVLGHEIGHVTARHGVAQASKAQLAGVALVAGSIFSPTFGQFSDLAQVGMGMLFLKHGRDAERQSDQLGVRYSHAAGYDPRKLSDFFMVFQNMREETGQQIPGWLSTHPDPPDRIRATAELAQQVIEQEPDSNLRVNRNTFLGYLEGLVFGQNPREGFTKEGNFYHPDLRFRIAFPRAWRVQNGKNAVLFLEPDQVAGVQLTLAPAGAGDGPEDRARQVAASSSVELLEGRRRSINGLPAFLGLYRIANQQTGQYLNALAAFIHHGDLLYELVGLAPGTVFSTYSGTLESVVTSFRELRDPQILGVKPDRISIYQVRRGGTLRDIARLFPHPEYTAEDLASLNRISADERLPAGTRVKVLVANAPER